jgi:hypothetical protein
MNSSESAAITSTKNKTIRSVSSGLINIAPPILPHLARDDEPEMLFS